MQRLEIHTYALSADTNAAMRSALQDRRLVKTRPSFRDGDLLAAVARCGTEISPDLLIVESHATEADLFAQLERLSELCRQETNLILLGPQNDVGLYRRLTGRGVHEYVPLPADPNVLADAILALRAEPDVVPQGRLIAFTGATGGAGSSTVAANAAWQLARIYGGEVALVDLDLASGTLALDLNIDSPQSTAQALAQSERLDDQMLERFLVKYDDNLALLTSTGECGPAGGDIDIAALDRLMVSLRRNAAWVVVDLPRAWNAWTRHVLDAADEVVLTAVPSLASLRNAKSAAEALNARRPKGSPVRLVLNRVGASPKTEIPLKDFATTFGAAPVGRLPYDPALFAEAAMRGEVVSTRARTPRISDPLRALAVTISGRREPERQKSALWTRILPASLAWAR